MNLEESLVKDVRVVSDFPKPGVNFVDISSITANRSLFYAVVRRFDGMLNGAEARPDYSIVGIDSRGFIFGAALACLNLKPLVLARKKGKLPGDTYSQEYSLEYGKEVLEMNKCDIVSGHHYIIVDDIIATGGTVSAVEKMIKDHGGIVDQVLGVYSIGACAELAAKNVSSPIHTLATL